MAHGSCATYSGYIYCVGGGTGLGSTPAAYYAPISSSGVGAWATTASYPTAINYQSCATYSGYIYCVGGLSGGKGNVLSAVYFAPVSSSGVSAWTSTTRYPTTIEEQSCAIYSGYIYCVGGFTVSLPLASGGPTMLQYLPPRGCLDYNRELSHENRVPIMRDILWLPLLRRRLHRLHSHHRYTNLQRLLCSDIFLRRGCLDYNRELSRGRSGTSMRDRLWLHLLRRGLRGRLLRSGIFLRCGCLDYHRELFCNDLFREYREPILRDRLWLHLLRRRTANSSVYWLHQRRGLRRLDFKLQQLRHYVVYFDNHFIFLHDLVVYFHNYVIYFNISNVKASTSTSSTTSTTPEFPTGSLAVIALVVMATFAVLSRKVHAKQVTRTS